MMNQNPPSYDSVFSGGDTIQTTIQAQPSIPINTYPILPSAPMVEILTPPANYGSINAVMQTQPAVQQNIIFVGGCPVCRIGILEDDYSCLGICLAIFCFPIGLICCLACKQKRCSNCGMTM